MKKGLSLVNKDLSSIITSLAELADQHRNTVMVGRTFNQHAIPITFGFKIAVWLDELLRHMERLQHLRKRVLVGQFGGAVGTLATLGGKGLAVRKDMMKILELGDPIISWHTSRDSWAELVFVLCALGATLGKIASEIATLMRTEINEVREPYFPGRGSSSTMPQKRNPIACPPIIAIAQKLRECVSSQLTAMIQDHERAVAGQTLEWLVIPETFLLISGSLKHSKLMLEHLEVDTEQMRNNLDSGGGFLMAESVMMGLAPHIGRDKAHKIVADLSIKYRDSNISLREALVTDSRILKIVSERELDSLLAPENYLGNSDEMIDLVLEKVEKYHEEKMEE
jgi:3-carboxy-cis,cis-muconate cycloisomerase